mgnify:CR=1 FL=1
MLLKCGSKRRRGVAEIKADKEAADIAANDIAALEKDAADKLAAKFLTQVPVWPARKHMMNRCPTHTKAGAHRFPLAHAPGDLWADARIDGRAG